MAMQIKLIVVVKKKNLSKACDVTWNPRIGGEVTQVKSIDEATCKVELTESFTKQLEGEPERK